MAVAATWKFGAIAAIPSIHALLQGCSSIDSVEIGIKTLESDTRDQYYVGKGGLPNADGEMEFDAAMMDHTSTYGAVMGLKKIIHPISVARTVLEQCVHNVLVGDGALQWAIAHGFLPTDEVLTDEAKREWMDWKKHDQDNKMEDSHDTIGLICLDADGRLTAGTSTSGWKFKHPGRVGDAPIVGSGIYCDGEAAAVATGDGEEIMRTCLSFLVVEHMKLGCSPQLACSKAIDRLMKLPIANKAHHINIARDERNMHAQLTVGVVAMDKLGNIGAASTLCHSNLHRGDPYFPAICWRGDNADASPDITIIRASIDGASY